MTARILILGGGFPGLYAARELRRRRVASARAAEDTRVLVMERDEFVRLAAALPAFRSYFQHHMAEQGLDFPRDEEQLALRGGVTAQLQRAGPEHNILPARWRAEPKTHGGSMEVATLIPTLALVTLLIATVAALISKKSTEERRKDPNAPKSTLAEDAPNTEAEKHS